MSLVYQNLQMMADDWVISSSSSVYIQMVTDDVIVCSCSSVYIQMVTDDVIGSSSSSVYIQMVTDDVIGSSSSSVYIQMVTDDVIVSSSSSVYVQMVKDNVIVSNSSVYIQMVTGDWVILNSSSVYIHPDDDGRLIHGIQTPSVPDERVIRFLMVLPELYMSVAFNLYERPSFLSLEFFRHRKQFARFRQDFCKSSLIRSSFLVIISMDIKCYGFEISITETLKKYFAKMLKHFWHIFAKFIKQSLLTTMIGAFVPQPVLNISFFSFLFFGNWHRLYESAI